MTTFLILRLDGVMQAWGGHTFEDLRPTENIPTRSGLLGLLGACLGIDRSDYSRLNQLEQSLYFTIRADKKADLLVDFHTIQNVTRADGTTNPYPVISQRHYLCDARFTVAIESKNDLDSIEQAVKKPVYTPVLGRRSCPLSRPLFLARLEASHALEALAQIEPQGGMIYSDAPDLTFGQELHLRDCPRYGRVRQFTTRRLSLFAQGVSQGVSNVPQ